MKLDDKIKELEKRVKELEGRKPETHLHFFYPMHYITPYAVPVYVPFYPSYPQPNPFWISTTTVALSGNDIGTLTS